MSERACEPVSEPVSEHDGEHDAKEGEEGPIMEMVITCVTLALPSRVAAHVLTAKTPHRF